MSRSWTWIEEDNERPEEEIDRLTPRLNALAEEWSAITQEIENESFRRQADLEDGYDYEPDCDSEDCTRRHPCAECREVLQAVQQGREAKEVKLEIIEEMLARLGARMMRPYEHWNEEERYMEYQESRYDYAY
jgi:hypothetical protein